MGFGRNKAQVFQKCGDIVSTKRRLVVYSHLNYLLVLKGDNATSRHFVEQKHTGLAGKIPHPLPPDSFIGQKVHMSCFCAKLIICMAITVLVFSYTYISGLYSSTSVPNLNDCHIQHEMPFSGFLTIFILCVLSCSDQCSTFYGILLFFFILFPHSGLFPFPESFPSPSFPSDTNQHTVDTLTAWGNLYMTTDAFYISQ